MMTIVMFDHKIRCLPGGGVRDRILSDSMSA
jgi:hypothetical protein